MFFAFAIKIARALLHPVAQIPGHIRMATEAKGSDVFKSAFTAPFDDRYNMVGGPGTNKGPEPGELESKDIRAPITFRLAINFLGELSRLKPCLPKQCFKDPDDLIAVGST